VTAALQALPRRGNSGRKYAVTGSITGPNGRLAEIVQSHPQKAGLGLNVVRRHVVFWRYFPILPMQGLRSVHTRRPVLTIWNLR
jgi:hypothetical protein